MKNYLLLLGVVGLFTFASCEAEDDNDFTVPTTTTTKPVEPTTQAADPADTAGAWSDWAPSFDAQTEDFTQTRSREVTVNGNDDGLAKEESRDISVTYTTLEAVEETERVLETGDVNGDGDDVDVISVGAGEYTASNGLGSFTVTDEPLIIEDLNLNFFTNNRGVYAANITLDGEATGLSIGYVVNKYGHLAGFNKFDDENCWTYVSTPDGELVYVDDTVVETTFITKYAAQDYADVIGQDNVDLLATYGVFHVEVALSLGTADVDGQKFIVFGENVYAIFDDGSSFTFLSWGGNLAENDSLETCDAGTLTSKRSQVRDLSKFAKKLKK